MLSAVFGADRDIAVCGALLHDIGKLKAYEQAVGATDLTDAGRLFGENTIGYLRMRQAIEQYPGFPGGFAQCLLHIVLSYHGRLEYGNERWSRHDRVLGAAAFFPRPA